MDKGVGINKILSSAITKALQSSIRGDDVFNVALAPIGSPELLLIGSIGNKKSD